MKLTREQQEAMARIDGWSKQENFFGETCWYHPKLYKLDNYFPPNYSDPSEQMRVYMGLDKKTQRGIALLVWQESPDDYDLMDWEETQHALSVCAEGRLAEYIIRAVKENDDKQKENDR